MLVLILERPSRSQILAQPKQKSTCVFVTHKKAPKTSKVKNESLIAKHVKSTMLKSRALTITMQAITTGDAYFLECIHDFMYIYLYHIWERKLQYDYCNQSAAAILFTCVETCCILFKWSLLPLCCSVLAFWRAIDARGSTTLFKNSTIRNSTCRCDSPPGARKSGCEEFTIWTIAGV